MSQFYDQASLVMVPSGYKDGKVYSQKPLSTDGELSFSRGSDIEATRVAANGYIEKAQVNLLLQSNSFSNSPWVLSNSTMTSGQAGYDGTNDAWLYQSTSTFVRATQTYTLTGVSSLSVYAKAGTSSFLFIEQLGTTAQAWFNLSTGALGSTTGSVFSSSITSVGNGWYRCVMSSTQSAGSELRIRMSDANLSSVTTAASNIYIQDAQLNYGLVAQTYVETTTAAVVSGITDNMPRLNYDPANPTCPSLLLEPSRTNVLPQSEYYGGSDWTKTLATISTNATTSPEGVQNASELIEDTSTGVHELTRSITNVTSNQYSISIFAKANTRNWIRVSSGDGGFVYFNLSTGAKGIETNATGSIKPFGNGWYLCAITFTAGGVNGSATVRIAESDGVTSYTGSGKSVYLYGFQYEAASYPSSYIPTYGASATRNADYASKSGIDSLIGQANGTLFFDFDPAISGGYGSGYYSIGVENGDYTNAVGLVSNSPAPTELRGIFRVAGGTGYVGASFNVSNQRNKIAIVYTASTIKLFKNGSLHASTSKGSFTNSMGAFNMTTAGRSGDYAMNQVLFFTSALSDAEAITLTTL